MIVKTYINDQAVTTMLARLASHMGDLSPCMRAIAEDMRAAVDENFDRGGRPSWRPSRRAMEQGGQTLIDTGRLRGSITHRSTATAAFVGTNVEYARIHQEGATIPPHVIRPRFKKALFWPGAAHPVKHVKHPGGRIPARPFLHLEDEDIKNIQDTILDYIERSVRTN